MLIIYIVFLSYVKVNVISVFRCHSDITRHLKPWVLEQRHSHLFGNLIIQFQKAIHFH